MEKMNDGAKAYEVTVVRPLTWQILYDNKYVHIVEGRKKALLIDSGYGSEALREYCRTLTDRPVSRIINNGEEEQSKSDYTRKVLREGCQIDLGNRILEVFRIPCHSIENLVYLDRSNRILFSEVEFGPFCQLTGSVAQFVKNMEKLIVLRHDFDVCYGKKGEVDASYVEQCLALGRDILAGSAVAVKNEGVPENKCLVSGHSVRIIYDVRNVKKRNVIL
ncbi:hypothetical protein [Hungatella hathewayi]